MKTLFELRQASKYYIHKPNHYFQVYEWYWRDLRKQAVKVLEVGVGKGGGLQLWRDYFPNGEIHGLDGVLPKGDLGDRIHLHKVTQQDSKAMAKIGKEIGPLDIVLDDASHIGELSLNTFLALFPALKPNGLYCIEDWGTGYWSDWPDGGKVKSGGNFTVKGKQMPSHQHGMVGFIKQLIDVCNTLDRTKGKAGSQIASMEIMPGLVLLRKVSQ